MAAVASTGSFIDVVPHETKKPAAKPLDPKIKEAFTGLITTHLKPFHAAVDGFYKYLLKAKEDSSTTLPLSHLHYGKSLSGEETNFIVAFECLQIASHNASPQQLLDLRDRAFACAYLLAFQKAQLQMQDHDLKAYEKVNSFLDSQSVLPIDRAQSVLIDVLKINETTIPSEKRAIFNALMGSISTLKLSLEEQVCLSKLAEYLLTYELSDKQVDGHFPLMKISSKA